MCLWLFNHSWTPWDVPYDTYGGHWKQTRRCTKCGRVSIRDIGFVQPETQDLKVPNE